MKLSEKQRVVICEGYIAGLSGLKLGKKYSTPSRTIYNILEKGNVKTDRSRHRKYPCNDNYFDELNAESSYWWGFIAADGYIDTKRNRISLHLGRKDRGQLVKFLRAIEAENPIYDQDYFDKRTGKVYLGSAIEIHSKQMRKMLLEYEKKGFDIIPDALRRHFIRGLFDGDGCIYDGGKRYTFDIIGKPLLIEDVQEYLMKSCNLNKTKLVKKYNGAWVLLYSGKLQLKRICDFLYEDSTVYMERKYKTFRNLWKKVDENMGT